MFPPSPLSLSPFFSMCFMKRKHRAVLGQGRMKNEMIFSLFAFACCGVNVKNQISVSTKIELTAALNNDFSTSPAVTWQILLQIFFIQQKLFCVYIFLLFWKWNVHTHTFVSIYIVLHNVALNTMPNDFIFPFERWWWWWVVMVEMRTGEKLHHSLEGCIEAENLSRIYYYY